MNILFENTTIRNHEKNKETYRTLFSKNSIYRFFSVFMLLSLIANIIIHIFKGSGNLLIFILVPVFFLTLLFQENIQIRTQDRRDKEMFGDEPVVLHHVFTDDKLIFTSKGSETQLDYSNIKKVYKSKNLILIHTKANLVYMLAKDGFTVGTANELIRYFKAKRIKVK